MKRRTFIQLSTAGVALAANEAIPQYRVVTPYSGISGHISGQGIPGPYPGRVVAISSPRSIDENTDKPDPTVVREMIDRGMRELTGQSDPRSAWARFFSPADVVAIKVNCVGRPSVVSSPEIVAEIVRNLALAGVTPDRIYLYERFLEHITSVNYPAHLPADLHGVHIVGAETDRGENNLYDPKVYVDVNFFGEDDTRSCLMRVVSQTVTKVINVPVMKDHAASGVTGCLKNLAYGSFSNVARSHQFPKTNTYSLIGTLAAVEPLRSKAVLQITDGLRGVWHGGPFYKNPRFRFYPKQILVGTDPVAQDRVTLETVEAQRRREKTMSLWDRAPEHLVKPGGGHENDPDFNTFVREPGHIEYASGLGLGVADLASIKVQRVSVE